MTTSVLHDDNASILTILPACQGLIYGASYTELVLDLMSEEIAKNTHEKPRLVRLKNHLLSANIHTDKCKLQVDRDKNLLMALAFPEIYTEALALVTGKGVSFELWVEGSLCEDLLEQYLFGAQQNIPIFTRVALEPTVGETSDEFADVNVILRSNKILRHMGYTINLNTFELEKLSEKFKSSERMEKSELEKTDRDGSQQWMEKCHLETLDSGHVFVDLYHWFCSCDDFDSATSSFVYTAEELLASKASSDRDQENLLVEILRDSPCKHSKVLPICKHILAVVIMVLNWDVSKQFGLYEYV